MEPIASHRMDKAPNGACHEHGAQEGPQTLPSRKGLTVDIETLRDMESVLGQPVELVREIANNGKCLVWEANSPVGVLAIKTVITDNEFYMASFQKEAIIYRAFHLLRPGPGVPTAHFVSNDLSTIVLEYLAGDKLSEDRYPKFENNQGNLKLWRNLRETLESLRSYDGYDLGTGESALERYRERWDKYIKRGVYTDADKAILNRLENTPGWRAEFNHGDPVPSNILLGPNGEISLVDWEFGGSYIPLYDIAVLWAISVNNPEFQKEIEDYFLFISEADRVCFATNVLNVASREIWIHRDLPDGHEIKEARLKLVEPLLDRARAIVARVLG